MTISPLSKLEGALFLKGDKSISHRAVMIASIARGRSRIANFPMSEDCLSTVKAFRELGVRIDVSAEEVAVDGVGLNGLKKPRGDIYLGNSGTSMRLISGILAGQDFETTLTGDESLSSRPMYRVIEPLRLMGADIKAREDKFAPLIIKGGGLKAIKYRSKLPSAQVKSAAIFAGLYADGVTEITEPIRSRDHTERMLSLFGAKLEIEELTVTVFPRPELRSRSLSIPGDISSAAFFAVAALILDGSKLVIKDVLSNRTRFGFIELLNGMNADIRVDRRRFNGCEDLCDITVNSGALKGITVPREKIPSVIDEIPVLMVAASFAEGDTLIKGAGELRVKETDRIESMKHALTAMGANISVKGDDILIRPAEQGLKGCTVDSSGDHRTAMSLAVAALAAKGESTIKDVDCIDTSFPDFFEKLSSLKH